MSGGAETVSAQDFAFVRDFLLTRSGLSLSAEKRYLVETRLAPVARRQGVSLAALIEMLRAGRDVQVDRLVVEAMTTNETLFFRDQSSFGTLADAAIPAMVALRQARRRLRIWCAAASSGQEPYSIAMRIDELGLLTKGWTVEILATDISTEMLEKARTGVYSQFEVQRGLPIRSLLKYFQQDGERWEISAALKRMVTFQPINLIRPFANLGAFDIILCRNVLIYFDNPTKTAVLNRLGQVLAPDGVLMLGAAETVVGLTQELAPHPDYKGLYTRRPPVAPARRVPMSA